LQHQVAPQARLSLSNTSKGQVSLWFIAPLPNNALFEATELKNFLDSIEIILSITSNNYKQNISLY